MENRNGQGIFLGVVGVATLVVAIIGATFAFFTAQIQGDNTVDAEAYVFNSTLSVSEVSDVATITDGSLIPMVSTSLTNAVNAKGSSGKICVDNDGYDACELYALTFRNDGTSAITFNGLLSITENGFVADHLQLVEFGAQTEQALKSLSSTTTHPLAKTGTVDLEAITVNAGAEKTIYLAVYLLDENAEQKEDMGKKFKASLTYTSSTGQNLTASF